MCNICLEAFGDLDLKINVKKSVCTRFGKRFKSDCSSISIDGSLIPWSSSVKYLGIVFSSGFKISIDFKLSRTKFFRNFNAIYSKIYRANESVIVSFVKSNCIPVLMYGLEGLDQNKTLLRKLDNPLFLAFAKVFKSFNKSLVNSCMFFFSTLPLSSDYLLRRFKFLQGLFRSENILLLKLQKCSGEHVLSDIFRDAQLSPDSDLGDLKTFLWSRFEGELWSV